MHNAWTKEAPENQQEYVSSSSYLVLIGLSWCGHSKLEVAIVRGYEITVDLFF